MDFKDDIQFRKRKGESDRDFIIRAGEYFKSQKKKDKSLSWDDFSYIMNSVLNQNHGESYYRKNVQGTYNNKKAETTDKTKKSDYDSSILLRELEQAKIQYRDERNAWNKQNYLNARVQQKLDYLEDKFSSIRKVHFPKIYSPHINSDNDMLVMLSDFHIGESYENMFGVYNADIAKARLSLLLKNIKQIQETHQCENCYVTVLGDLISGNIHLSVQVTNRENVIDQIKEATQMIGSFVYELCGIFNNVYFTDVVGNHTRIAKKEEQIHDERLDSIISWGVGLMMKDVDNFHSLDVKPDSGISVFHIRGKTYVCCHGDYDPLSKNGVQNLSSFTRFNIDYILMGHIHSPAFEEYNGIKVIRGGSLSGSGNQYTIEKRLFGKPTQTVCVCGESGVKCMYPIELNLNKYENIFCEKQ